MKKYRLFTIRIKLKQFMSTKPALEKVLKRIFYTEQEEKQSQT
jgi:hypothetical protein